MQNYEYKPGDFGASAAAYPPAEAIIQKDLSGDELAEWYSRGAAALSRHDVECCAQGDADAAVRMALSLKFNHIMFHLRFLESARRIAPALFAFVESGAEMTRHEIAPERECEQLALF